MAKKQWISIKRGFIRDPKHRIAIGECVWLFQYMLDVADWDSGKVLDWKDEAAAEDMQMNVRTLREQRRKLESLDYISCLQKQYNQEITIMNWTNPREYSGEVYNPRKGDSETAPSDFQGDTQGDSQSVTPTFNPKNQNTAFRRGEQEQPEKVSLMLEMANFPGAKKEARIDSILSYLGESFRRNTSTKEWKEFAKYILSEKDTKGWDVQVFVKWLLSKHDYKPDFWSVKRMMEFYPQAFETLPDEEMTRLL